MKQTEKKICAFAGHRTAPQEIEDELRIAILHAITQDGVKEFWCGGMGAFDLQCAKLVREAKTQHEDVRLVLVLPSLARAASAPKHAYDELLVADDSDGAHPKRAITLRNRWMAKHADLIIAYIQRDHGGAYAMVRFAARYKKPLRFIRENAGITQRLSPLYAVSLQK
ncbi:MAG: DUF1273 domain-containing protein [Clostridia bacterium]|nr:DUF1273 domain-containing protein [Clostridia bacterium]